MSDLSLAMPVILLTTGAIAVLLLFSKKREGANPYPPAVGAATAAAALVSLQITLGKLTSAAGAGSSTGLGGFMTIDRFGVAAATICLVATLLTALLATDWLKKADANNPEFIPVLLIAAAGMVVMTTTGNLVGMFLGIEIMSVSLYILSAFRRGNLRSIESGLKYFLAGAFASGLFLMGIALNYGVSGGFDMASLATASASGTMVSKVALILLLCGFAFKLSLAPFHQWAADVYEGAPTPVTGFMSTAVKVAGFTAFTRIVLALSGTGGSWLSGAMVWLALLTMIVGNLGALAQTSVKRMLAYSSIGHAGYLMMAPIVVLSYNAASPNLGVESRAIFLSTDAMIFYLAAYALTNLLAFGSLAFIETREGKGLDMDAIGGLRWRHPVAAVGLLIAMLSLAGVPPTAGFLGKFRLFGAVLDRASVTGETAFYALIAVAVLTSLVSLGYYLRVIMRMTMHEPEGEAPVLPPFSPAWRVLIAVLVVAIIVLGFAPSFLGGGVEGVMSFLRTGI
jgi:NADH-quinone oxidoreductase subunit N